MITSVYLSNNNIQVLIGIRGKSRVSVQNAFLWTIPEGCLINGVVTDEVGLTDSLKEFWYSRKLPDKGVELVIDSTQFITKTAVLPKLSEKKTLEIVEKEFLDVENREDPVYDYMVLDERRGEKSCTVICAMVERSFIDSLVQVFAQAGVVVSAVRLALSSELKLLYAHPALREETSIVMVLDGDTLGSVLILNGEYKYSNRTRLFSEHATANFGTEIARNVSSIVQFNASEKSQYIITKVYFCGFEEGDFAVCREPVESLNLEVGILPWMESISVSDSRDAAAAVDSGLAGGMGNFIYPVGNLLKSVSGKDIDFFIRYKKKPQDREKMAIIRKAVIPPATVFVVMMAVAMVFLIRNLMIENKIEDVNSYLESPLVIESRQNAEELLRQQAQLKRDITQGKGIEEALDSYPLPDSRISDEINTKAGDAVSITLNSYDASTGVFQFSATAANVEVIHQFIENLKQSELFADLEYSGYIYVKELQKYNINVNCYLSESAGK